MIFKGALTNKLYYIKLIIQTQHDVIEVQPRKIKENRLLIIIATNELFFCQLYFTSNHFPQLLANEL